MTDKLLTDLDAAAALGMKLCGLAAERIRQMLRAAEEAEKRHAESRADALAAALAEQQQKIRALSRVADELHYYGYEDCDVDVEDVTKRLTGAIDAIVLAPDPEPIGTKIVADARKVPDLEREVAALRDRDLTRVGLDIDILHGNGIMLESFQVDHDVYNTRGVRPILVHGASTGLLTLRGHDGRGLEALARIANLGIDHR